MHTEFCPICGARHLFQGPCSPRALAAIDGAHTRAQREDDGDYEPRIVSESARLFAGLAAMENQGR